MLQFDVSSLVRDILKECTLALKKVGEKAKQAMIREIESLPDSGSHDSVGALDWRNQVKNAINYMVDDIASKTAQQVIVKVGLVNSQQNVALMQKAFLVNYGMGKTADIEGNPWIAEYLVSDFYDADRDDFGVFTRPGEMVYDPYTNSSQMSTAKTRYEIENFWQNPSHFFENGMRLIVSDFNSVLDNIINNFNFVKYLKSTIK